MGQKQLAWVFSAALAQDDATVSGRVVNGATGTPVPFATITVTSDTAGSEFTAALTDESGRFILAGFVQGRYFVTASFIGFEPGPRAGRR